jgi:hypothetical protein
VRPRWVIALMIVMSGIGLALLGDLIPTAHKLDKWAALAESLIGVSLGLFGYPVFGRGAAIKPADDKQPPMSGAAVVLVLALGALSLGACRMSDYARADLAITAQTKVANATTEAVTAWDETKQAQLVADARVASSTVEARAEIAKDQRTLKFARAAIRTFGAAIQAEAVGVELARQAKAKLDLGALLPRLLRLGRDLIKSLKDFGVTVPNIPLLGGA